MSVFLFLTVLAAANGAYLLWAGLERRRIYRVLARRLAFQRAAPAAPQRGPLLAADDGGDSTVYRWLSRLRLEGRLYNLLEQAGNPTDAAGVLRRCGVAAAAAVVAAVVLAGGQPALVAGAGAAAALVPLWHLRRTARARMLRIEEQLPSCLEFVGRSMRAGHGFSIAMELIPEEFAEPLAGEFRRAWEEHSLGMPLETALHRLATRVPLLSMRFFVCAVSLQKRTGGNLAEILDKLAEIVRERFKLRARIRAISAHGRMTAAALSLIPIGVAGLMWLVNRPYMRFFTDDPRGPQLVGAAVALQITGYLIIRQMVNIEV